MTDENIQDLETEDPVDPDPDSSPFAPAPLDTIHEGLDGETIERG